MFAWFILASLELDARPHYSLPNAVVREQPTTFVVATGMHPVPADPDPDLDEATYRPRFWTRGKAALVLLIAATIAGDASCFYYAHIRMPGRSYRGPLTPFTDAERARATVLRADVEGLVALGSRDATHPLVLASAARRIAERLAAAQLAVARVPYRGPGGREFENVEATIRGSRAPDEAVVIGAHYDTADGFPGADDNTSGVAVLIALAHAFARSPPAHTLRFVAFANEEPPYFQHEGMGSLAYARACRARGDRIRVMVSLESLGYYDDAPGSQHYPFPLGLFFGDRGDFVAFVANTESATWARIAIGAFRATTSMPSEGGILGEHTMGAGWSDHWSFWQAGYAAFMVTDTAVLRNPNYHRESDTVGTLRFDRLARVSAGLEDVIRALDQ